MENLELDNKAENVTKTTKKEVKVTVVPKESKFVTAEEPMGMAVVEFVP